eukprot:1584444-Ditylum_brightwellii.AAC.1
MIKLNDYLEHFLVPDGVTATKISCKVFIDVLEDRILYQWKLEIEKEAHTTKEHDKDGKRKRQDNIKAHH